MSASSQIIGKLSKEDYRKQKDLEAARKAGTAPAERDEEGKEINPHIPQYISKAPWYLDTGHASLKHQRVPTNEVPKPKETRDTKDEWYARGIKAGPTATKYRKGACDNCGAMTHKTRECVERPRKLGAKWTGRDIQADELTQNLELGWDEKRDRWNGYDPIEHDKVAEEYERIEEERRKLKATELDKQGPSTTAEAKKIVEGGAGGFSSDDDYEDEEKYAEQMDMPGQKINTKTRTTIRNLRIREDTAKYLLNLDINSAHYDPKTRSMRDNPIAEINAEEAHYAGDNFVRYTGDAPEMAKVQLFAWNAAERGNDVHLQANPTQLALLHKQYESKKEKVKDTNRDSILQKYGGEEHLEAPPKELLLAQTENYVEYSRTGRLIKGLEKAKAKSKYEEDVYVNNHTTIWGSYWMDGRWGYKCCRSFLKNAYCTGLAGIEAAKAASASHLLGNGSAAAAADNGDGGQQKTLLEQHLESKKKNKGKDKDKDKDSNANSHLKRKDLGEGDIELDSKKLKKALKDLDEQKKNGGKEEESDERKRKYNSAYGGAEGKSGVDGEVSEEQLEAYRLRRQHYDDPMANYKDDNDD